MRSDKKNAQYFDDDFEVTYEDDISFDYDTAPIDFETQDIPVESTGAYSYSDDERETPAARRRHDGYEGSADRSRHDRYKDSADRSRKRRYRPTRLAAPIQRGGNAVLKISRSVIRNLTLILMLAILILMAYNFFRGSTPYGDIENEIATNTYSMMLTGYFAVGAVLILYELCSMLWAMTRVRVRDQYGVHREDVGRGLFSFIFLYLCSYAAFWTNGLIPESIEVLKGIKGALDVFGAMHNALFGFCLAGVISCLFRKYSLSL